ncbi:SLAM family member 7 isoform X4 [Rhinolophus ferrumequinum]|uniref:SLAM family member 7 isoform X4 n=1 Tax=Rhinolophus ferrumequinum TaxID=59479 RepID=UPI00140F4FE7|nr:SLAM family member 7 isoform X4 [Rhinolophus ferrumequinum]
MPGSPACFILIFLLCQLTEHLPKPKVTMSLQNNKNGTCVTNLTCFMEQGGEDVTYSWKSLGQATNESHYGSILPVSWRLGEKDISFICMARNPISSNSSNPISAWKLCEGAADNLDSTIILNLLWVFLLLSVLALVPVILIMWRERRKENYSRGKFNKYALFHGTNTQKDGKTPPTAHITRYTKAICI